MSTAPIDPKASARAFYAVQLRRLRTEAKLTQPELGQHPAVMVSGKLIGAVENLYRPPSLRLSRGLDQALCQDAFFEGIHAAIRRESALPTGFFEYLEYEAQATMIKTYEDFVIDGLLQTEDYARAVLGAGQRADKLEELVAARMDRQAIMRREDPPWLITLLDAAAVRRLVGGPEVMRGQLEHLLDMARQPTVTVQVIPDGAQVFPEGAFRILGFRDEPDVGYVEQVAGRGEVIQPGAQVGDLEVMFGLIRSVCLPATDSEQLIQKVLEEL